ncbi:DUF2752 domain-containing protein [Streptomyces sp. 549]|uniref:DUF2752 domain-containing protein n=1 Tax=Streptomyces sp. 549 TaxID=3049076 RepID=UPI0024C283E4|nr:DUF2752 domain-containing protein [Streptomyces sp. 549]MDK1474117.1 DUF2752 domain-containing protein [Streptomyces sp. 549]
MSVSSPTARVLPAVLARLAVPAGVGAAVAYVGAVDPGEAGHYPPCPLLSRTGLLCPGCGGLRAVHALAHGDVVGALAANAAVVAAGAVVAAVWVVWCVRPRIPPSVPMPLVRVAGVLVLVFSVVRNLPFGASLAP